MRSAASGLGRWAAIILAATAPVRADEYSDAAGAVVERWIDAIGGSAALGSIRTITSDELIEDQAGAPPVHAKEVLAGSGLFHLETTTRSGETLVQAYDGRTGWRDGGDLGFGLMSEADLRGLYYEHDPALAVLLAHHYAIAIPMPGEVRNGAACDVYLMRSPPSPDERWFLESATGRVVAIEADGAAGPVTIEFSDYRPAGPLILPYETRTTVDGRMLYAVRRQRIAINEPVPPGYFAAAPWDLRGAARVEAVLDRYVKSCGSADAAGARRTRVMRETVETPASGMTSSKVVTTAYPDKILVETDTQGMGRELEGYDGTTGWAYSDLLGFHVLKRSEIQALFSSLSIQGNPSIGEEAPLRRMIGERIVAGRKTTALALSSLSGPIGTFYFDEASGRLLRIGSSKRTASGERPLETVDYSDYRTVDGADIPFVTTATTATLQVITKLESVKNDVPVDLSIFAPRPEG